MNSMHSKTRVGTVLAAALSLILCASCERPASETPRATATDGRDVVITTFYPMQYFTTRVVGSSVEVELPVPTGEDPIFWQPPREAIQQMQSADLIISNGAEFEKWIGAISLPESRLIRTAEPFRDQWISYESATTHSHGSGGAHTHAGIDGHTWLDPLNAKAQAKVILAAVSKVWPDDKADYEARFRELSADLDQLHEEMSQLRERLEGVVILASHPAYNYIASRYNIEIRNLDLDPEAVMTALELDEVRSKLNGTPDGATRLMLWESEPLEATRDLLSAELGVHSVLFSPCESDPSVEADADADYLSVMRANLARLAASLPD